MGCYYKNMCFIFLSDYRVCVPAWLNIQRSPVLFNIDYYLYICTVDAEAFIHTTLMDSVPSTDSC